MLDKDYIWWKSSPDTFYQEYRRVFRNVIDRNCFSGHRNPKQRELLEKEIRERMISAGIVSRIRKFEGHVPFLSFYTLILKGVVEDYSQEEDLHLLDSDYNALVVKYSQLAEIVLNEMNFFDNRLESFSEDIQQQTLTRILEKEDSLKENFDRKKPFRNYIWSVFRNECLNAINHETRYRSRNEALEDDIAGKLRISPVHENNTVIINALKCLHARIKVYLTSEAKLIICLKVVFYFSITGSDIRELTGKTGRPCFDEKDVDADPVPDGTGNNDDGILQRFSAVRPFLNQCEKTNTDENSYWRWTNNQVNILINYLNERHMMSFDRDSFASLLDRYFSGHFHFSDPKREGKFVYMPE